MDYFGDDRMSVDPFSDNCPYFYPSFDCRISNHKFPFLEEAFGASSMCFTGTAVLNAKKSTAESGKKYFRCLNTQCVSVGDDYKLVI